MFENNSVKQVLHSRTVVHNGTMLFVNIDCDGQVLYSLLLHS